MSEMKNETYTVKGRAYSQQFTDKKAAQAEYDLLHKRQLQQKQSGKISLTINTEESSVIEQEVTIGANFFNRD